MSTRAGMNEDASPVLLYDGLCGFCDRTVQWLLRVDRGRVFRFAPLSGEFATGVLSRHPDLQGIDSLVLVEPAEDGNSGRVWVRSGALIKCAKHLSGMWHLLTALALVPRPLRDWGYDAFARRRYRLFGRFDECPVPPPDVRDRFLD